MSNFEQKSVEPKSEERKSEEQKSDDQKSDEQKSEFPTLTGSLASMDYSYIYPKQTSTHTAGFTFSGRESFTL